MLCRRQLNEVTEQHEGYARQLRERMIRERDEAIDRERGSVQERLREAAERQVACDSLHSMASASTAHACHLQLGRARYRRLRAWPLSNLNAGRRLQLVALAFQHLALSPGFTAAPGEPCRVTPCKAPKELQLVASACAENVCGLGRGGLET